MTFTGGDGKLDYLAKDSNHMGILAAGSTNYGSAQNSLIFGDYYFLEALARYEAIPEPASLAILAAGLVSCVLGRRRRRAAARG